MELTATSLQVLRLVSGAEGHAVTSAVQIVALDTLIDGADRDLYVSRRSADLDIELQRDGQRMPVLATRTGPVLLVLDGRRRLNALRRIGARTIKVQELQWADVVAGIDLDIVDRMFLADSLLRAGLPQNRTAALVGIGAPRLCKWCRVFELRRVQPGVWRAFLDGALSEAHLVAIAAQDDLAIQERLSAAALADGLSARELRGLSGRPELEAMGQGVEELESRVKAHLVDAFDGSVDVGQLTLSRSRAGWKIEARLVALDKTAAERPRSLAVPLQQRAKTAWVRLPGKQVLLPPYDGDGSGFDSAAVPAVDGEYEFDDATLGALQPALFPQGLVHPAHPFNVMLVGAAGDGKTSLVRQLAARWNVPLYVVTGTANLDRSDMLGSFVVGEQGRFEFKKGPVSLAYQQGALLLLDEVSVIDPDVISAIHGVLNHEDTLTLGSGETVRRARGFRIFMTSNTVGAAAFRRRRFAGNKSMNEATLSRADLVVKMPPITGPRRMALMRNAAACHFEKASVIRQPGASSIEHAIVEAWLRAMPDRAPDALTTLSELLGRWFDDLARAVEEEDVGYLPGSRDLRALIRHYTTPIVTAHGVEQRTLAESAEVTVLNDYDREEDRRRAEGLLETLFPAGVLRGAAR